jgi:Ca2+-binding RTX toxin-like protein
VGGSSLNVAGIIGRVGTDGADTLTWIETAVSLNAGGGDDVITSGPFNGTLNGGAGNDTVNAGAGIDTLTGGLCADVLKGDAGNDFYVFNRGRGIDTIYDDYRTMQSYSYQAVAWQGWATPATYYNSTILAALQGAEPEAASAAAKAHLTSLRRRITYGGARLVCASCGVTTMRPSPAPLLSSLTHPRAAK